MLLSIWWLMGSKAVVNELLKPCAAFVKKKRDPFSIRGLHTSKALLVIHLLILNLSLSGVYSAFCHTGYEAQEFSHLWFVGFELYMPTAQWPSMIRPCSWQKSHLKTGSWSSVRIKCIIFLLKSEYLLPEFTWLESVVSFLVGHLVFS